MTVPEINQLRKEGHIQEAYTGCKVLLQQYPDDRHVRMSMAWCLKSVSEKAAKEKDVDSFVIYLGELSSLRLQELGEIAMHNRFGWDIKTLFDALKYEPDRLVYAADRLMEVLPSIHFQTHHRYYTLIADSFLKVKGPQNSLWSGFKSFMDWFGLDNLLPEDYNRIPLQNGKSIPSVAERLHGAFYKSLMAEINAGVIDSEKTGQFLERLTHLNEIHPEYQYTLYHKSLLLLALGRKADALESIRPFVKRKQNDFWVWDVLSDTSDDTEIKLSCLCRALMCRTEAKFLGKVRLKTARLMRELGYDSNAKTELLELSKVYDENGWRTPREALQMMQETWFAETSAPDSNISFYRENIGPSEEFLFLDAKEYPILVTHINHEKRICSFITEDKKKGFFSTRALKGRFNDNAVCLVRFDDKPQENCISKVLTCKPVKDIRPYYGIFFRKIEGSIKIRQGNTFGFVDDIFIDGRHITDSITNGTSVTGTAVLSFNTKKQQWGWRAVHVKNKQTPE